MNRKALNQRLADAQDEELVSILVAASDEHVTNVPESIDSPEKFHDWITALPDQKMIARQQRLTAFTELLQEASIPTPRFLQLLIYLQQPRSPHDVEMNLEMDRMTLKYMQKRRSNLINKRTLKVKGSRGRGRLPVEYELSKEGRQFIAALLDLF